MSEPVPVASGAEAAAAAPPQAGPACALFAPHKYLQNKCLECGQPQEAHVDSVNAGAHVAASDAGTGEQPAAATDLASFENLSVSDADALNVLKDRKDCAQYLPHAWIYDRCRECGCSEAMHVRDAQGQLIDVVPEDELHAGHRSALGVLRKQSVMNHNEVQRQVQVAEPGKIDIHAREEAIAAAGGGAAAGTAPAQAKGPSGRLSVTDMGGAAPPAPSAMSPTQARAERDMQNVVAKMTYFEREKARVREADSAKLAAQQITQEEFDRREREL